VLGEAASCGASLACSFAYQRQAISSGRVLAGAMLGWGLWTALQQLNQLFVPGLST
jgi:hypothetical protein